MLQWHKEKKSLRNLEANARGALLPLPRMSLPDWADKYRRLTTQSGAVGGPWRTSRFEVARGPMLAVKERGVQTITAMVATQTLKTELILNTIGYHAHLDPSPMLLALPKDDAVKMFSKERLTPMTRATPVLNGLFRDRDKGISSDTIGYKEFAGGFLAIVSAGSPMNLAARPIRVTLADEIDKYENTKEGDPIKLLEERAATFMSRRLHIRCSSPTWEEGSRIFQSYRESDMRRPFVACPHCAHEQTLDFFRHVHWDKDEEGHHFPATAAIYCEKCGIDEHGKPIPGKEWTEVQRLQLITTKDAIKWKQTRKFECCGVEQEPLKTRAWTDDGRAHCQHCGELTVPTTHAGFTASKLYSPVTTVAALAKDWIDAKENPETKQTFYNTQLALPFSAQIQKVIEPTGLAARREEYKSTVPAGVLLLTAGVDVQAGSAVRLGRLEVEVVGWGLGEESWSIATKVFEGDPSKPEVWTELDTFLQQGFEHELGGRMVVNAVCVDSGGHNTEEVYKFCRARIKRNVWAIKGASDRGGQWSPVWNIPKLDARRTRVTGYRPQSIGVNSAKEAIRQRLMVEEVGPGYCHFPMERTDLWFAQLTSEQLVVERKGGATLRKWHLPRGRANEALDCRVYAYAALCGWYARGGSLEKRKAFIDATLVPKTGTPEADAPEAPAAPPPVYRPQATVNRVRRSTWMS